MKTLLVRVMSALFMVGVLLCAPVIMPSMLKAVAATNDPTTTDSVIMPYSMPEGTNAEDASSNKQALTVVPKSGVAPVEVKQVIENATDAIDLDLGAATQMINETASEPWQPALAVTSTDGDIAPETIEELRASGDFEYVNYAVEYKPMAYLETPNDPRLTTNQPYLRTGPWGEDFGTAWDLLNDYNNSSVKVAVIDTGWVPSAALNSQAEGANITGVCKMSGTSVQGNLTPVCGQGAVISTGLREWAHGSNVAMIIGAKTNNGVGMAGAAYDTPVNVYSVMDANGYMVDSSIANMLNRIVSMGGEKVVNISLGAAQTAASYNASSIVKGAIQNAVNSGVTVVAAAGNSRNSTDLQNNLNGAGKCQTSYPASDVNTISVGATDRTKSTVSLFSDCNSNVDISAEGVSVAIPYACYSNGPCEQDGVGAGTSYSAPQVAAAAALLYRLDPAMTNEKVRNLLNSTAYDVTTGTGVAGDDCNSSAHIGQGRDDCTGYGVLNIGTAAMAAVGPNANGDTPVYRLACPWGHFWTTSPSEVGSVYRLGCKLESAQMWDNSTNGNAQPIYRLARVGSGEHFWTNSLGEKNVLVNSGQWAYEGVAWKQDPNIPVYRLQIPGEHFYTSTLSEATYLVKAYRGGFEGSYAPPQPSHTPVYRIALPREHFFTANAAEAFGLCAQGYASEGIGWYTNNTLPAALSSQKPVYRVNLLYNGEHFFTTDVNERNVLVANGNRYEGIAFYYDPATTSVPIYRLRGAVIPEHMFTASSYENTVLINSRQWISEGVRFYGVP